MFIKCENSEEELIHKRGRLSSFPYIHGTGHENHRRVIRRENHETMVTFKGAWFPRSNDPSSQLLYCTSVLALLKPWRHLNDIKHQNVSFEDAFADFMHHASIALHRILDNIQYYYDCSDKAKENREITFADDENRNKVPHVFNDALATEEGEEQNEFMAKEVPIDCRSARDVLYADIAMNIATEFRIFDDASPTQQISNFARHATKRDMELCKGWLETIQSAEHHVGESYDCRNQDVDEGGISFEHHSIHSSIDPVVRLDPLCSEDTEVIEQSLNEQQAMAYTILKNQIQDLVSSVNQSPLLMIVTGPGGTGKTRMLQALTSHLRQSGELNNHDCNLEMNTTSERKFVCSCTHGNYWCRSVFDRRDDLTFVGRDSCTTYSSW